MPPGPRDDPGRQGSRASALGPRRSRGGSISVHPRPGPGATVTRLRPAPAQDNGSLWSPVLITCVPICLQRSHRLQPQRLPVQCVRPRQKQGPSHQSKGFPRACPSRRACPCHGYSGRPCPVGTPGGGGCRVRGIPAACRVPPERAAATLHLSAPGGRSPRGLRPRSRQL